MLSGAYRLFEQVRGAPITFHGGVFIFKNTPQIALSLVDSSESRVREELRQRDQRKLYELLADLFEEVRRSGRSVVAEPPTLLSAPQMIDVSPIQHLLRVQFQPMPGFAASCNRRSRGTGAHASSNSPTPQID